MIKNKKYTQIERLNKFLFIRKVFSSISSATCIVLLYAITITLIEDRFALIDKGYEWLIIISVYIGLFNCIRLSIDEISDIHRW